MVAAFALQNVLSNFKRAPILPIGKPKHKYDYFLWHPSLEVKGYLKEAFPF
jgi:hypothetical protein